MNNPQIEELFRRYINNNPHLSIRKIAFLIKEKEDIQLTSETIRKYLSAIKVEIPQKFSLEENEILIPDSWYNEKEPYILPKTENRIAIMNDIHIPFHSIPHLRTAIDYIFEWKPNTIILNGDIMDCYAGSIFLRDPNYRDLAKEAQITRQFLEFIRNKFPDTKIYYKFGNHEQRWQFYLWRKAEEMSNLNEIKLENVLKLYQYHIEYIPPDQIILAGKLNIAHGHEIFSSAGAINVARNLRLKAFDNLIVGHFHRTQEDIATTISGKAVGVWTIGCLCGLRPTYRPTSFWNAGFGLVEWEDDFFSVQNKKIILNKVL